MPTTPRTFALLLAATAALAACADLPFRMPGERAAELKPTQGLVVFKADTVGERPVKRIQYADNEQRVDYALYRGGGAQAEFIYMDKPGAVRLSFRFPYTIADKVAVWNFSKGRPVAFDQAVFVRTRVGYVFVRPYALTAENRRCFGVSGEWDRASDDPNLKFTRIMFGYYCAPAGQPLTDQQALKLVDNIGIRGVTERAENVDTVYNFYTELVENFAGPQGTQKATDIARNGVDGRAGIAEFPFRYAEYYQQSGKDDFDN